MCFRVTGSIKAQQGRKDQYYDYDLVIRYQAVNINEAQSIKVKHPSNCEQVKEVEGIRTDE